MQENLLKKIQASQTLNGRQKWALLKYLRFQNISEEKQEKLVRIFDHEKEAIENAQKKAEKENIQKLEEWNNELVKIFEEELPKIAKEKEKDSQVQEEQAEEELLNQLNNL